MFVILVYDVKVKRVSKVHKICRKYLKTIQRSVFEGHITQKQLADLQKELEKVVCPTEDSVCIYQFESMRYAQKVRLGYVEDNGNII